MKVLKFGGTSVGSVNSILSVKKIVEAIEEPVIVVVSALGASPINYWPLLPWLLKATLLRERIIGDHRPPSGRDRGSDRGQGGTHGCPEESDGFTG